MAKEKFPKLIRTKSTLMIDKVEHNESLFKQLHPNNVGRALSNEEIIEYA